MGDYTSAQLIVYACPPEEVRAFTGLIEEYGLLDDWCGKPPPADRIVLGHTYCGNDVNIGFVNDYRVDAPNSAWVRWNDPKYEYLGDLEIHVPELGLFAAECDAQGDVRVTSEQIIKAIKDLPEDASRDQVLHAIDQLTGEPWHAALRALATWEDMQEGPTVIALPLCANCGEMVKKNALGAWRHLATDAPECGRPVQTFAEPEAPA